MVRRERPCDRPAGRGLHHRCFDFEVVLRVEKRTNVRNDLGTHPKDRSTAGIHDQVHVALPIPRFLIGQPVELLRQRPQRLGQQTHFFGHDSQLAGLRTEQHPCRSHDVADVPLLEFLIDAVGDTVALEPHLNLPGTVLQFDKTGFAHDALGHHASGDRDMHIFFLQRLVIVLVKCLLQLVRRRVAPKIVRVRIALLA